ncbi:leucine-rich repeat extensin-like protein 5 [Leguminivora glycinivorella]|uniref:leucine-rich repeat extensin-like protein 5 n=1 Tax=Leguminivora glycinivorella TaxID=1035111 RepID=UPI00200D3DC4|nr:leucine-rich repeat extensin-like protein 5 [Leguminivora glycinivorella]
MSKRILMFVAFAALVCANEVEDSEQKKRGAGKGTSLNSIPTGAQKPEYTYQVYSQTPSSLGSSYQTQAPNSFYPSQASSQYYSVPSQQEVSPGYSSQPQINLIPPPATSPFLPINFVPNPGYQSKYQIIPSKTANGNIQLLIQPSSNYQSSPFLQYPQSLFSPNPANHQYSQQQLQLPSQQQFNVASPYQQLPLGQPYLGQPSPMFLLAPPNPYNNLLYPGPNPSQSFYNYYPSNAQQKYNLSYGSSSQPSVEYEKAQGPVSSSLPKEDNDIGSHGSDYVPSDSSTSYKTAYATSRSGSYSKLK